MQFDEHSYTKSSFPKATLDPAAAREQIDRLLASNTFHASDALRRLLRFLADKTFRGEADDLKEYSVGLDALGKPPTYDPRQDAAVRIQASRLRQKLDDYYRNEGQSDPLVVELPKGRFKIAWRSNGADKLSTVAPPHERGDAAPESSVLKTWRRLALGLGAIAMLLAMVSVWALSGSSRTMSAGPQTAASTPELNALWSPFLSSGRHLIIAFSNPVFVGFNRNGGPDIVYRTRGTREWEEAVRSPEFFIIRKSLGNPPATPNFNMVERGTLVSTFVLGQFFARRRGDISLARLDELSWQQFAENDLIIVSPSGDYKRQSSLPVHSAFIADKPGIRNLLPLAGEPQVYPDPPDHQESDGEGLELVSMLPGPMGRTTILTFAGNHAWAVLSCVQSLTDSAFSRLLVEKLKKPSGRIPPYYQMVVKVKYRDGTATHASYVTHRALMLMQNSENATDTKLTEIR